MNNWFKLRIPGVIRKYRALNAAYNFAIVKQTHAGIAPRNWATYAPRDIAVNGGGRCTCILYTTLLHEANLLFSQEMIPAGTEILMKRLTTLLKT